MDFTATFTDIHGITHTDAYMRITRSRYTETKVTESKGVQQRQRSRYHLRWAAVYWTNEAAKDAGAEPLVFVEPGACVRTFDDPQDVTDVAALAASIMQTEILPGMA